MQRFLGLIGLVACLALVSGCEDGGGSDTCQVRFRNDSASKTVMAVWDGLAVGPIAPGELTDYREANEGVHTMQWIEAGSNKELTTVATPSLVAGHNYTFPYVD